MMIDLLAAVESSAVTKEVVMEDKADDKRFLTYVTNASQSCSNLFLIS